jgi:hypothetical protein
VPAKLALSLKDLKAATHTLSVEVRYTKTVTQHGRKKTMTVTKTLKTKFLVC